MRDPGLVYEVGLRFPGWVLGMPSKMRNHLYSRLSTIMTEWRTILVMDVVHFL